MKIKDYAVKCRTFVTKTDGDSLRQYLQLGIIEEIGEVSGKIAKVIRARGAADFTHEEKEAIVKELGDVCWFVVMSCNQLEIIDWYIENNNGFDTGNCFRTADYPELLRVLSIVAEQKNNYVNVASCYHALTIVYEIAKRLGYTLDEVMEKNIEKLTDRQARGVICGDGDNR